MNSAATYYEQDDLWKEENYTKGDEKERVLIIKSMIPSGVKRILDVGCGNGAVTNELAKKYEIWGMDISSAALKYVKNNSILGGIDKIPFKNNEFDLIICTEVLEHLPQDIFGKGIKEISRVSNKYILISVPFAEKLQTKMAKCASCGCTYHTYHHVRSFPKDKLENLLPGYMLEKFEFAGAKEKQYTNWDLWWRQNVGNNWSQNSMSICPLCNSNQRYPFKWNLATIVGEVSFRILPRSRRNKWAVVLYKKNNGKK